MAERDAGPDLSARLEVTKLAHELDVGEAELEFLTSRGWEDVRVLRTAISTALFERHEKRFRRVAALSNVLPAAITAKIAEVGFGPGLCARVAAVMDPKDAVGLAERFKPAFLTDVSLSLDPSRAAAIIGALPQDLVVDVGRRLVERGEVLALGRFVSVVDVDTALRVIDGASGAELLRIALFTEDRDALDRVVDRLDDTARSGVTEAAVAGDDFEGTITLLVALSPANAARFLEDAAGLEDTGRSAFIAAVSHDQAWPRLAEAMDLMDLEKRACLLDGLDGDRPVAAGS